MILYKMYFSKSLFYEGLTMVAYEKKLKHTKLINTFYTEIILHNYIGKPRYIGNFSIFI